MIGDTEKSARTLAAPRDRELEAEELGPSVRMMRIAADAEGTILYQFGKRQPRRLHLPHQYARRTFGMVDQTFAAAFINLKTNSLEVLASYGADSTRAILFGENWGKWIDEEGRIRAVADPDEGMAAHIRQWRIPVSIQAARKTIAVDFSVNIYARQLFHGDARCFFREGKNLRHAITLIFEYPSGGFLTSTLSINDSTGGRSGYVYDVPQFPLIWPAVAKAAIPKPVFSKPAAGAEQPQPGNAGAPGAETNAKREEPKAREEAKPKDSPKQGQRSQQKPEPRPESKTEPKTAPNAEAKPQAKPQVKPDAKPEARHEKPAAGVAPKIRMRAPVPETAHLSVHDMIGLLSTEDDADRRWRMIEPNLAIGRPERTYALISHHSDLIAEKAKDWPAARLKAAFSGQPGAVMIALMMNWTVNQALAVAEANAENARIMEWLREREIDRLLKLDLSKDITTATAAREALGVDTRVDAPAVKKAWRTLLGFLNADHGRAAERAIHRRKDEIAKRLHEARDLLMAKM